MNWGPKSHPVGEPREDRLFRESMEQKYGRKNWKNKKFRRGIEKMEAHNRIQQEISKAKKSNQPYCPDHGDSMVARKGNCVSFHGCIEFPACQWKWKDGEVFTSFKRATK